MSREQKHPLVFRHSETRGGVLVRNRTDGYSDIPDPDEALDEMLESAKVVVESSVIRSMLV